MFCILTVTVAVVVLKVNFINQDIWGYSSSLWPQFSCVSWCPLCSFQCDYRLCHCIRSCVKKTTKKHKLIGECLYFGAALCKVLLCGQCIEIIIVCEPRCNSSIQNPWMCPPSRHFRKRSVFPILLSFYQLPQKKTLDGIFCHILPIDWKDKHIDRWTTTRSTLTLVTSPAMATCPVSPRIFLPRM